MISDRDKIYLKYILDCIIKIEIYAKNDRNYFFQDSLVQDAVLRRLQTMAESTQKLSDEFKMSISEIDWRALSGFRNILVHEYLGGIDMERTWDIIKNYLPDLKIIVKKFV